MIILCIMRSYLVTCTNLDLSFRVWNPHVVYRAFAVHLLILFTFLFSIHKLLKKPQQVPNNRKTWLCFKNLFSTFFKELTHISRGTLFENYSKSLIYTILRAKRATFIFKENRQNRHLAEFHQKAKIWIMWKNRIFIFGAKIQIYQRQKSTFPFWTKWHWVLE